MFIGWSFGSPKIKHFVCCMEPNQTWFQASITAEHNRAGGTLVLNPDEKTWYVCSISVSVATVVHLAMVGLTECQHPSTYTDKTHLVLAHNFQCVLSTDGENVTWQNVNFFSALTFKVWQTADRQRRQQLAAF